MTREEIQAMGPKELAEMTATHVMGWIIISEREDLERRQTDNYVQGRGIIALYGNRYIARSDGRSREWNPGEDISAAWEVEERMNADELFWRYTNHVKKLLLSKMSEGVNEYDMMHAPPEIRCKAALLAVLAVLGEEE